MTDSYIFIDGISNLDDVSFDFDSDSSYIESRFSDLYNINYLWRMVSSSNESKFYALREGETTVSLYEILRIEDENESDSFLRFMFYSVLKIPEGKKDKGRKSARLNINKIIQLANSDSIFLSKLECIRISIKQEYPIANHWDMIYVERDYYCDDEIIRLLGSCTELFKPTENFDCRKLA